MECGGCPQEPVCEFNHNVARCMDSFILNISEDDFDRVVDKSKPKKKKKE